MRARPSLLRSSLEMISTLLVAGDPANERTKQVQQSAAMAFKARDVAYSLAHA